MTIRLSSLLKIFESVMSSAHDQAHLTTEVNQVHPITSALSVGAPLFKRGSSIL